MQWAAQLYWLYRSPQWGRFWRDCTIANMESKKQRTTKLYDRTSDQLSLDEVERVVF